MKSGESIAQQMVVTLWIPGTPGDNTTTVGENIITTIEMPNNSNFAIAKVVALNLVASIFV